jgi:hypothetical protein
MKNRKHNTSAVDFHTSFKTNFLLADLIELPRKSKGCPRSSASKCAISSERNSSRAPIPWRALTSLESRALKKEETRQLITAYSGYAARTPGTAVVAAGERRDWGMGGGGWGERGAATATATRNNGARPRGWAIN